MAKYLTAIAVMLGLSLLNSVYTGVPVSKREDDVCEDGGSCTETKECYRLHKQQNRTMGGFLFSCSDESDKVCCPVLSLSRALLKQSPEMNMRLLPLEHCGMATEIRIYGGQEAYLGQFPWMALIGYRSNESSASVEYRCGGSLISKRYVLTAAHCMNYGSPASVRLGEHDLSKNPDCEEEDDYCADPPVDVNVEKVILHEEYNHPLLKNDIALLRLSDDVSKTEFVSPICLPFNIHITGEERKRYTVAGWGKVERKNHKGSNTLLYTKVLGFPVSECNRAQPNQVRPIGELQLCAGDIRVNDVCKGDSGGPMMDTRVVNGTSRTQQVGIVSFGFTSCGGNIPSVYTRVTAYLTWILSNLEP